MKRILTTLTALALLTSCYKAEFHATNHPEQAEVDVTVVPPTLTDGTIYTDDMTLIIDGESYTVEPGETFTIPNLLDPGVYTYYVYSNHTGDGDASVNYDPETGAIIASIPLDSDGYVDPNPNKIYFGTGSTEVSADSTVSIYVGASVLGRDLNFVLDIDGDASSELVSFTAELNGVAQQWDCVNDTPYGDSASVIPSLSIVTNAATSVATRSTESYHLEGTIHLLGVSTDETKILTLNLGYTGDNPDAHIFVCDVTEALSGFNDDKSAAMTLSNTIETPTLAKPDGSIGDWIVEIESTQLEAK